MLSFRQALADEAFVPHPAVVPRFLSLQLALPTTHSWHGFSIADCIALPFVHTLQHAASVSQFTKPGDDWAKRLQVNATYYKGNYR